MTDAATGPNAAMHTNWNTASAPAWIAQQAALDRQLGPLGDEAMAAPQSPPTRAWLELDGRPNHQVTRFQMMAPKRPANTVAMVMA